MSLWRKLTVDWPACFGDWLWEILVVETARRLETLTFRRILLLVLLIIAAVGLAQVASLDVAFLLAGDVALYIEALTIITLVAARGHILHTARAVYNAARHAVRRRTVLRHLVRRRRSVAVRRMKPAKKDDDAGALVWAFA
jgi:Na+/H+-dicarboxylate symporter